MADGDWYSTRLELEHMVGRVNIFQWADVDRLKDAEIVADRIDWSNKEAYIWLNGIVADSPYPVPFEIYSTGNTPVEITSLAARLAAIFLKEGSDTYNATDPTNTSAIKNRVMNMLKGVLNGGVLLHYPNGKRVPKAGKNQPFVHKDTKVGVESGYYPCWDGFKRCS